jgi:2-phospho-L-lactate guanylyltransferase
VSGVWAVVPVKCFARGKSRLERVLSRAAREDLARALCDHTLATLSACETIAGTLVATDCEIVQAFAEARGAEVVRDVRAGSLNQIADHALAELAKKGARSAIVLMGDLPLLDAEDIQGLVGALGSASVVVAPDRVRRGTNALGLTPPDRMATCFGSEISFRRHVARARKEGIAHVVHRSDGIAFDLDSPDDLARALALRYAERGALLRWNRKRPSRVRAA